MLGLWERIRIKPLTGGRWVEFKAKLDTGAEYCRIGAKKAAKLRLGPITDVVEITTSGGGRENRLLVPAKLRIGRHRVTAYFTISMRRPGVNIGRRVMRNRFTVNASLLAHS